METEFVFETCEMTSENAGPVATGRPSSDSLDSGRGRPLYVDEYVNERLCRVLDHDAITLAGLCRFNDHTGFTLRIDLGGPLAINVAVEMVAHTRGVKYRAVTWGSHEQRDTATLITTCYSHAAVCFAALREAREVAPGSLANQSP